MKKNLIAIFLAICLGLGGFAGGMVLSYKINKDNYSNSLTEKNKQISDLQEQLSAALKDKEGDINQLKEQLDKLNKDLKEKDEYLRSLENSKNELQRQYDALLEASGSDAEELDRLTSEIAKLQQQLETAESDKEELQTQLDSKKAEIENLKNELKEKETKISELNQSISTLTEQVASFKSQLEQLQGEHSKLQERYESINKQYQSLLSQSSIDKQQIQNLTNSITELNARIDELEKENESLKNRLGVDPFNILSYQKLKLSDDRYLVYKDFYLRSFHSDYTLKTLKEHERFDLETKAFFHVLQNGDVLLGSFESKLYLYKNELDELIEITGHYFSRIDCIKEFSDKYVMIGGYAGLYTTYGDTVVINIETGEFKNLKDVGHDCLIGLSKNNLLFTGWTNRTSNDKTVCYLFDIEKFDFVKISTETQAPWSDSVPNSLSLKNGDILFEWGYKGLYLFSLKDKAVKEILSGENMRLHIQSESNGKVTIKDDYSSEVYEYDINSQTVTKKQS